MLAEPRKLQHSLTLTTRINSNPVFYLIIENTETNRSHPILSSPSPQPHWFSSSSSLGLSLLFLFSLCSLISPLHFCFVSSFFLSPPFHSLGVVLYLQCQTSPLSMSYFTYALLLHFSTFSFSIIFLYFQLFFLYLLPFIASVTCPRPSVTARLFLAHFPVYYFVFI